MKKIIASIICAFGLISLNGQQVFVTNEWNTTLSVVQELSIRNATPVVSSLMAPYTNAPLWIKPYVYSQIYTNGLTTNNVKKISALIGEPVKHPKNVYQGNAPVWPGVYYTYLTNIVDNNGRGRVLPGDKVHLILDIQDSLNVNGSLFLTNYSLYKIVNIPLVP